MMVDGQRTLQSCSVMDRTSTDVDGDDDDDKEGRSMICTLSIKIRGNDFARSIVGRRHIEVSCSTGHLLEAGELVMGPLS